MDRPYRLNPFSTITDTPGGIVINTANGKRASFAKQHRDIVDLLISRRELPAEEIQRYLAVNRIKELEDKRILLRGKVPPVEGRYSRQLGFFSLLSDDFLGLHEKVRNAHVLVLGAGAIGSHMLWNLAAIGVGRLTVVDFDVVEETNLNRQLMYTPDDVGQVKVEVLCRKLRAFNPTVDVVPIVMRITSAAQIADLLDGVDLVVKAIDTPEEGTTWLNEVCVAAKVPYVTGGFLDQTGAVGPIYIPDRSVCWACFGYTENVQRLHGTGPTFAPLTTIVSSMLAMISFKILTGNVDAVVNKFYGFDLDRATWETETIVPTKVCEVCGTQPAEPINPLARRRRVVAAYRSGIMLLLLTTLLIRYGLNQPFAGVPCLVALFLSVPAVAGIFNGDAALSRRELFTISCCYIVLSLVGLAVNSLVTGSVPFPQSVAAVFDIGRLVCTALMTAAISTTILFLALVATLRGWQSLTGGPTLQTERV